MESPNPDPYRIVPPPPDRRPFRKEIMPGGLVAIAFGAWALCMIAIGWFAHGWIGSCF